MIYTRQETRKGMRQPEWRVICDCGWTEKGVSAKVVGGRAVEHGRKCKQAG